MSSAQIRVPSQIYLKRIPTRKFLRRNKKNDIRFNCPINRVTEKWEKGKSFLHFCDFFLPDYTQFFSEMSAFWSLDWLQLNNVNFMSERDRHTPFLLKIFRRHRSASIDRNSFSLWFGDEIVIRDTRNASPPQVDCCTTIAYNDPRSRVVTCII